MTKDDEERCYACQEPILAEDEVMQLREEDGTMWLVHTRCLSDRYFEMVKT